MPCPYESYPMRYVTSAEIKEMDRKATEEHGIPSLTLMENAGRGVSGYIQKNIAGKKVVVVCGVGNNGGDGFVIARLLHEQKYEVSVFMLGEPAKLTSDARTNLERLRDLQVPGEHLTKENFPTFEATLENSNVIVDSLFGVGLKRPLEGLFALAVEHINSTDSQIVAVDIPSGLHADTGDVLGSSVFAHHTLTMGLPKHGLVKGEGPERSGKVEVLDIGFPPQLLNQ